jgi:1,4-dihydroxy-2-naphthoate octaprenyltransferase
MRNFNQQHTTFLIFSSLTYFLGAGIARYLGGFISSIGLILGWFLILAFLMASFVLDNFFKEKKYIPEKSITGNRKNHILHLQVAGVLFVFCGLIIIGVLNLHILNWSAGLFLLITVSLLCFYSIQPFWLSKTSFDKIILAFCVSFFIPVFSFLLHGSEIHQVLFLVTIPLIVQTVAYNLAIDFSTNGNRSTGHRQSLLDRIPRQTSITIHDSLVLAAYLIYSIIPLFGISWKLIWPIFLTFPLSLLEIIWLHQIVRSTNPNWKYYEQFIPIIFGLPVYLLLVSFWTR